MGVLFRKRWGSAAAPRQIWAHPDHPPPPPPPPLLLAQQFVPFAVCGSTTVESGRRVRRYPWGVVEVENESHCDFTRLREAIIRLNMTVCERATFGIH